MTQTPKTSWFRRQLNKAYPFIRASTMLLFYVIVLEAFTITLEGRSVEVAQSVVPTSVDQLNKTGPQIIRYLSSLGLLLVATATIFAVISLFWPKTWMAIAKVLAIEHLFEKQEVKQKEGKE